jgi:PAS domain S-box-containing protein
MVQHVYEEVDQLVISDLYKQLRNVLGAAEQPILIYLDDKHKVCNRQFAEMLGYTDPHELSGTSGFLELLVDDEASRNAFMEAYWLAINNMNAVGLEVTWRRKDESKLMTSTVLVPMEYKGHILLVQFVIDIHD